MKKEEEILNIIEREFDLELLLKYRELRIIEHEIERGKELKELLEKLILNGNFIELIFKPIYCHY